MTTWQNQIPPMPPEEDPEQVWWFYGKTGPWNRTEYHVIRIIRAGESGRFFPLFALRGMDVEPKEDKWDGWWQRIPYPPPPA